MKEEKKEKITKFLFLYSKILVISFGIVMLLSSYILITLDTPDCYREATSEELIFLDSEFFIYDDTIIIDNCTIVSDVDKLEKEFQRYKLISIFCIIGYMIFNPRVRKIFADYKKEFQK